MVLGGLLEDLALKDLLGYYEDETLRRAVFSPTSNWFYLLLNLAIGGSWGGAIDETIFPQKPRLRRYWPLIPMFAPRSKTVSMP